MPSPDKLSEFLDQADPALLGVVATLRADGGPHTVPVWYRYDGQRIHIWSHEPRAWVQNVLRDNRVAFTVPETRPPFGAVILRGRAQVRTGAAPEIVAEIHAITRRYIPAQEVESYVAAWPQLRTIVSITPEKVTSWDRGY
jgi:PPOX class probable F420-dependent enzyme